MKKNNEILAILLAVISLFIFVSLLEFKSIYEPYLLFSLFNSENMSHIQLPFTGILGASISAILIKYFLGYGSFMVCTIMFMYSYLIFTQKDYRNKKYVFLSLYQIAAGLWISVFLTWYIGPSNEAGIIGYVIHCLLYTSDAADE